MEQVWEDLVALLDSYGWTVSTDTPLRIPHCVGCRGHADSINHEIWVRGTEPRDVQVRTLIHEAGHVIMDHEFPGHIWHRWQEEVVVETVAWHVASLFGFQDDDFSAEYVRIWRSRGNGTDTSIPIDRIRDVLLRRLTHVAQPIAA
jgi:hypothetical protein